MRGILVQKLYQGNIIQGENLFSFTLDSNLPKGVYFIEIKENNKRNFKKLIKN